MGAAKILVVDDEKEICEVTKSFLERRKYIVFTANGQADSLEIIKNEHPHIAIIDLRLGSDSGLEVLRLAKDIDKNLIVVMVTALDDEDSVKQAKALGADDYITKPFTAGFLNELISKKIAALGIS